MSNVTLTGSICLTVFFLFIVLVYFRLLNFSFFSFMLCYHICWWNKVVYKFGGTRPTGRIACLRLCTTTLHIITVSTLYVEQVVNLALPSLNSSSWPSSCFMICLLGTCKNGWTDRDVLWVKTRVLAAWRRPTSSGVRRTKEVNPRRARLVPGWMTIFGRVYDLGM